MNFKLKPAGFLGGAVLLMVLTSAVSTKNVPLEVGYQAPEISISKPDGERFLLSDLQGENVVVNFWSVSDAESRISNIRLARDAERNGAKYIGMCVDSDRRLAEEVMAADGVAPENQYFTDPQIHNKYLLDQGIRTVKIDPYGIVAAID
ncbi:MAG: redoxin domain-containing protein [Bacteroides sp.]|nr:redoxin domain-containing protein [Bacteroides sp.]